MRLGQPAELNAVGDLPVTASTTPAPAAMRVAGQHARATQRRYVLRAAGAVVLSIIALVVAIAVLGLGWASVAVEAVVITGIAAVDAKAGPLIERWHRGATGEERVGQILDSLRDTGWLTLHDVHLGTGNIDHVLVGPAGIYTVETKSHRGKISAEHIDSRMLKQAYAEAKLIERIAGLRAQPLLVFSNAYLTPAVSHRDGVVILPARMLANHLQQRDGNIPASRVAEVYARLAGSLPE